jgi:hypothetical protein
MDPRLPDELAGNHELDNRLVSLQKRYDDLFINNAHEFSFNDFHSDEERQQFIVDSNKVFDEVKRLIGPGKYVFEEDDWLKKS